MKTTHRTINAVIPAAIRESFKAKQRLIGCLVIAVAIFAEGCQNFGQTMHDVWYKPIGTIPGTISASIRNQINPQQQAALQQNSPGTLEKIQHNDDVAAQQAAPSQQVSAQTQDLAPLTVDDIKALASSGVKDDVVTAEIQRSNSRFSQQDITDLQQAGVSLVVIDFIKTHAS